jgi:Na+-translocating ferredoxin:NAD+ oxidoreductase RnfC subunit
MEREVQSKFDEIWSILERTARRSEEAEARFNRRMDRAEKRMDLADKRMDRAEQRGELADRRIEATRKLVEAGMKIVMRDRAEIKALGKRMDAYLRNTGNGHNGGNGHSGPKRGR